MRNRPGLARPRPTAWQRRAGRRGALLTVAAAASVLAAGCSGGTMAQAHTMARAHLAAGPAPSGPPPAGYAPWAEAENSATHTSAASRLGPRSGHVRWKRFLGGNVSEGPSVAASGTIYESNDAGVLFAINQSSGRILWRFSGGGPIGGDLSTTAAILPDGTIVWPGSRHTLFGLSPQGKKLWAVAVGGVPLSPVIASLSQLYVMTLSGVLFAIKVDGAKTAPRWTLKLGAESFGSPVIRSDGVIETTVDHSLVAVRDEGGSAKLLWRFTVPKRVEVSPAVAANGTTILGTNDGFEYGISSAGKQLWKDATNSPSYSSPAVTSTGTAYFGDNGGTMIVASVASGKVSRSLDATPGNTSPAANIWTAPLADSAGDVYYGTHGGGIYGYSPTGKQLFAIATGKTVASYPALTAAGDLLIGSDDGYLYSIGG